MWLTPIVGMVIGVVYLVGFSVGGHAGTGVFGFAVMVVFSVGIVVAGRRSETVRGLLDRRDERLVNIDLRATAFTAAVMIITVLIGFVVEVGRGHSGHPYDLIGAVGGLAYLAAIIYQRVRG